VQYVAQFLLSAGILINQCALKKIRELVMTRSRVITLSKWAQPLPSLHIAVPITVTLNDGTTVEEDFYRIEMVKKTHTFHPDAKHVPVWCYVDRNPSGFGQPQNYLGPVIEGRAGRQVTITWDNQLPTNKQFPFTQSVPAAGGEGGHAGMHEAPKPGHAIVHMHGAHCPPESDGWPMDFLHPQEPADSPHGTSIKVCHYPNDQVAATMWYHDHTMGITRLNVYAGLAGAYLLRDDVEDALNLPKGEFEVPLVIQDRMFGREIDSVRMHYEVSAGQPEFFGDHIVVNGAVWPFMKVQARRYRLRMVNGSNSRFYRMRLQGACTLPTAHQIGTDGGFLAAPVQVMHDALPLILAPGERADVMIDFSACAVGAEFVINNNAATPYDPDPSVTQDPPDETNEVLKFIVAPRVGVDTSELPLTIDARFTTNIEGTDVLFTDVNAIKLALSAAEQPPIKVRRLKLIETTKIENGEEVPDQVLLNGLGFEDPITEDPRLGGIEIWEMDNTTGDVHPVHIHLIQFLVLDRKDKATNLLVDLDENEKGWKDTARCNPDQITRFIVRFEGHTGRYVWHCHMLEHEDHDMMRPLLVRS
jgi:spore coat protein A, manganese oxidase